MPYNPMGAPSPEPRKFKNTVRCLANEIISLQEAVDRKVMQSLPEGEDANAPYWFLQYVAVDSRWDDGSDYTISSSGKLFTKDGKVQDNRQRPFQVSRAFAGLGISAFPGDPAGKFDAWCTSHGHESLGANPDYDASKVVNNHFIVEKPAPDRNNPNDPARFAAPLPIAALGPAFVFSGDVKIVTRNQSQVSADGSVAPTAINFRDIMSDEAARASVLQAIVGHKVEDLGDVLLAAGVSHNFQVNGESVVAAAMSGTLAGVLATAGHIMVVDDVVSLNGTVATDPVPVTETPA